MKSILPYLSAIALAAVIVAVIAPTRRAGGQDESDGFPGWEDFSAAKEDAAAPYRSGETSEPSFTIDHQNLPPGRLLVALALHRSKQYDSVFARLRHTVRLEGNEHSGSIVYWQQGRNDQLQIYLETQIREQEASLLQVANDRFLWVDRRLPTGRTVTRFDLRAIRAEQRTAGEENDFTSVEQATALASGSHLFSAQFGGMPGLLAAFLENFEFLPTQAMQLTLSPSLVPEESDDKIVPVFAVVGHWKPDKLTALAGQTNPHPKDESGALITNRKAPDRFPLEVLLLLRQSDLFPQRIEYRKLETPNAVPIEGVYHLSAEPLLVLELAEAAFNVPVAAGQFDYQPPQSVEWKDLTATLIERLRKERQPQIASGTPTAAAKK
jgi:hypothetical protein